MSKYLHLNEDEIISHVEKFGTEDEKDIVTKLRPKMAYEDCPHCENMAGDIDDLKDTIKEAIEVLS